MTILIHALGTFLMFLGFHGILLGLLLFFLKQKDMGRRYMTTTLMSGGETSQTALVRWLTAMRASRSLRFENAPLRGGFFLGLLLALTGAALG